MPVRHRFAAPLWAALSLALAPVAGAQQPAAATVPPDAARPLVSMCTGCHSIPGYQASFPRVYRVPMISGQNAKYIEAALQAYRKGDRDHPTMMAIARGLTDDEIVKIAAYYAARGTGK